MKKNLSVLAVLGIVGLIGIQSANAFTWSNLNPFSYFGNNRCNRCEKVKPDCGCNKIEKMPCTTGAAAPCDSCQKTITNPKAPCDACDRLQQQMAH